MKRLLVALCLLMFALGWPDSGPIHAATLDQEWAAVQMVVGPWQPQDILAPSMNATGMDAIRDAALLGLSDSQFVLDQDQHPAYMMATIQFFLSRNLWRGDPLIVESFNDQTSLLDLNTGSPTSEATLVTRICTGPLATSYLTQMVAPPTPTPVPTSTPIPTPARVPTPKALGGTALFPPPATFVLPVQYGIPGAVTIMPLAPGSFPGPIKPLSRTEYDMKGGMLSYRISVFSSTSDGVRSLQWQLAQLDRLANKVGLEERGVPYSVPNEYDYSVAGFEVVAILFRNLEIVVSEATAGSGPVDYQFTAYLLYQQAHAFAVLQPFHKVPSPDTSGSPIMHVGGELMIPASIAGGLVQLGYNDDAAVYFVKVPGQQSTTGLDHSYSIEPMPSDLIAQATLYDHGDDALASYFQESHWPFTKLVVLHQAIAGERAFWVNYSKAPSSYHMGSGVVAEIVFRNLIITVTEQYQQQV